MKCDLRGQKYIGMTSWFEPKHDGLELSEVNFIFNRFYLRLDTGESLSSLT